MNSLSDHADIWSQKSKNRIPLITLLMKIAHFSSAPPATLNPMRTFGDWMLIQIWISCGATKLLGFTPPPRFFALLLISAYVQSPDFPFDVASLPFRLLFSAADVVGRNVWKVVVRSAERMPSWSQAPMEFWNEICRSWWFMIKRLAKESSKIRDPRGFFQQVQFRKRSFCFVRSYFLHQTRSGCFLPTKCAEVFDLICDSCSSHHDKAGAGGGGGSAIVLPQSISGIRKGGKSSETKKMHVHWEVDYLCGVRWERQGEARRCEERRRAK